jgi:uncharacterized delta-60 repeat protein
VQRDGKVVVAGRYQDDVENDPAFFVGRLGRDGQVDPTFGDGGMVVTDFGGSDWASGVAVQADGRIVAAGVTLGTGGGAVALARYTPSGALDTTFGGDGKVVTDVTPDGLDHATGVVATPSGKLVVSGQAGLGAAPRYDADLLAVRYTATGRRDRTLNGTGVVRVDVGGRGDYADDLTVTRDGGIVLAGQTELAGSNPGGTFSRAVVVRLTNAGARDGAFGEGGVVRPRFGGVRANIHQVTPMADGRLLLAGVAEPGDVPEVRVGRLHGNGRPDRTFAGDGVAAPDLPFDLSTGTDVAALEGGKVLVMVETPQGTALVRLRAAGGLDPSWGSGGVRLLELDGSAPVMRVVAGDRVVAVGTRWVETEPFRADPWTLAARVLTR